MNESSVTDARATPKTIGTSENATGIEMYWPRTMAESTRVKTGSAAFTIWVNETAPAPAETTAPMWPSACRKPIGASVASAAPDSRGGLRSPVSQSGVTKSVPTSRLTAECVHGSAMEFSRCLFAMLYPVDSANHSAKYTPSFAFFSSEFGGMTEQPSSSQSAVHSSVPRSPHVSVTDVTEPSSCPPPHRLIASRGSVGRGGLERAGEVPLGRRRDDGRRARRHAEARRIRGAESASAAGWARRANIWALMTLITCGVAWTSAAATPTTYRSAEICVTLSYIHV